MGKKLALAAVAAFVIAAPLALLTDVFASVPWQYLSVLTKRYWDDAMAAPESPPSLAVLLFAGPVLVFFLAFWFLWNQRNKQEAMLAVLAHAADVQVWLDAWAQATPDHLPEDLRRMPARARKLSRRLRRLLSLTDGRNWRWSYTLYLIIYYFRNAPTLRAFRGVRVEPPPDIWPEPQDIAGGASPQDTQLLTNALEFSGDFVKGAKAWSGHTLLLHSVVGGVYGAILAGILGGLSTIVLLRYTGTWSRQLLAVLALAVAVGLVLGYLWQRISSVFGRRPTIGAAERAAQPAKA